MKKSILIIVFLTISVYQSNTAYLPGNYQLPEFYYSFEKHNPDIGKYINTLNIESIVKLDFDSLTIPMKRAGNLILIETIIDGQYGNLIFDTGCASELVLNSTYFRDYKSLGSKTISGVNGAPQNVKIIKPDSLVFSDMKFYKKYVEVTDLSNIENRLNTKIIGFFGLQLIDEFEIVIDIKNNVLQLFVLKNKKRKLQSKNAVNEFDYIQTFEVKNNVVFLWVKIAGKDYRFCFDTAAEKNLISYTAPKNALNSINITGRAKLIGAGKKRKEVLLGRMSDFMLGERSLYNMDALIADISALNTIYETDITGVLGYDFLTKGKISLNLPKKRFGIEFYK